MSIVDMIITALLIYAGAICSWMLFCWFLLGWWDIDRIYQELDLIDNSYSTMTQIDNVNNK